MMGTHLFVEDLDGLAVDNELAVLGRDLALELSVGRVVLELSDDKDASALSHALSRNSEIPCRPCIQGQ